MSCGYGIGRGESDLCTLAGACTCTTNEEERERHAYTHHFFSAHNLENGKLFTYNIQIQARVPDFQPVHKNSNKKTIFVVPSSESKTFSPHVYLLEAWTIEGDRHFHTLSFLQVGMHAREILQPFNFCRLSRKDWGNFTAHIEYFGLALINIVAYI